MQRAHAPAKAEWPLSANAAFETAPDPNEPFDYKADYKSDGYEGYVARKRFREGGQEGIKRAEEAKYLRREIMALRFGVTNGEG